MSSRNEILADATPHSKAHGNSPHLVRPVGAFWWPLCLLTRLCVLQDLLHYAVYTRRLFPLNLILSVTGRARIMQTNSQWMIPRFSQTSFEAQKPLLFPLPLLILHVTINPRYCGAHTHFPRETATHILRKHTIVLENSRSCLHNCPGEPVSDQWRL